MERARGQAQSNADPGMVVQPYVDPGYRMPNTGEQNLPQNVGNEVYGWLPSTAQNPLAASVPTLGEAPGPSVSRLDQWLAEQRAKQTQQ